MLPLAVITFIFLLAFRWIADIDTLKEIPKPWGWCYVFIIFSGLMLSATALALTFFLP